ncbi:hypothetical protein GF336_06320 [Candidatus Woesearchaeota archaeon]|nr:hypothetical protein [Candidatus Woesearchaeota archaeon]
MPETIQGRAILTKDGFYIEDCLLKIEELRRYDPKMDIEDSEVRIICSINEKEEPAQTTTGEILQGREGTVRHISDIISIEKIS